MNLIPTRLEQISTLFGVNAPDTAKVPVWDGDFPAVPRKDIHHFDLFLLKMMFLWVSPLTPRHNLLLVGDGGVGKTSSVLQFAARMNIPVYSLGCSGKTRYEHLVGSLQLRGGDTIWEDGPLLRAWRFGGIFLANEITRMNPDEQMRLVDALDKNGRITVPETGEVVSRHPNFRFAATGNSGGFGDESGAYPGEKVASYAFMDRFMTYEVKPLSKEEEINLVKSIVPGLNDVVIDGMVTLAHTVRDSFVGKGGALRITISPRAVIDWALLVVQLKQIRGAEPLKHGLEVIVLNGKPQEDRQVVQDLFDHWIQGSVITV